MRNILKKKGTVERPHPLAVLIAPRGPRTIRDFENRVAKRRRKVYARRMKKQLTTRTKIAEMAGVALSTVTRAALKDLAPAVDGDYIDAAHPAAIEFIKTRRANKTKNTEVVTGIDPLFQQAVIRCAQTGKHGAEFLKKEFSIGSERARKLRDMIAASGVKDRAELVIPDSALALPKQQKIVDRRAPAQEYDYEDEPEELTIPKDIIKYADLTLREVIQKYGTATRFVDYLKALKEIGIMAEREIRLAEIKGKLVSRTLVQTRVIEQFDEAHMKLLRDGSKTIAIQVSAMCQAGETTEEIEKYISSKITDFIRPAKEKITRAMRHVE